MYKNLPKQLKTNPQNAVPIKVWLYPLTLLDSKAAWLEREISTSLISNIEYMMEELGEVERTCNDLSRSTEVNVFSDLKERLHSFHNSFSTRWCSRKHWPGSCLPFEEEVWRNNPWKIS